MLRGSTTPRLWTRPLVRGRRGPCGCGCALTPATSLGFSAVDFATGVLGFELIPWQRWLLIHALELRTDGRFRFRTVLVLVARQNGKTTLVEVKNLWKMFVLQVPLVIGTAQNLDISEESWDKAVEIVEGTPELAAEIEHIDRTNGKKALRLANGSRWKIAAASRKGGRGLSGDDVNLDELREHQSWDAWGAVTKTTMARRKAQVWAFSNAGDDKSVVLNDLQDNARAAAAGELEDSSVGLFEWSAPDGCPIDEPEFWAMANPSLGYTITPEALRSALETDPEPVFRTECLCQRVANLAPRVIPARAWAARGGATGRPAEPIALALAAAWPDAEKGSIAVAGLFGEERLVQVTDHRPGIGWMVDRAAEIRSRHKVCAVVVDPAGPAGRLIAPLEARGIEVVKVSSREAAQASGQFYTSVMGDSPDLRHYDQPELEAALAGAQKRPLMDAWTWARKGLADISPLEAATLAAWGHASRAHAHHEPVPLVAWA
jgi:hypothetical protein